MNGLLVAFTESLANGMVTDEGVLLINQKGVSHIMGAQPSPFMTEWITREVAAGKTQGKEALPCNSFRAFKEYVV